MIGRVQLCNLFLIIGPFACGQTPSLDTATFDADGTAHLTRVIPMPNTISPEAQKWLASLTLKKHGPQTLEQRRASTDEWRKNQSAEARRLFPVNLQETSTGGVRTDILTPLETPDVNRDRVLVNLQSGKDQSRICLLPTGSGESLPSCCG